MLNIIIIVMYPLASCGEGNTKFLTQPAIIWLPRPPTVLSTIILAPILHRHLIQWPIRKIPLDRSGIVRTQL